MCSLIRHFNWLPNIETVSLNDYDFSNCRVHATNIVSHSRARCVRAVKNIIFFFS